MDVCLAVDAKAAGALFGLSERAWRRLDVAGHIPRPIKVGRLIRWRLAELAAGRERFEGV
jgi:predicted DNA-binding transcriptional regulator AlpA